MDSTPLDIRPGDIIAVDLSSPLRYDDGAGGEDKRWTVRLQVDDIGALGISGRGADNDGAITPNKRGDYDRLGGEPHEKAEFFPWATISRIRLMYRFAEYEAIWDAEDGR